MKNGPYPLRHCAVVMGALAILSVAFAPAQEKAASSCGLDSQKDLAGWNVSGDAAIDGAQKHGGAGSLRIGPGAKALWKLRESDGAGKVSLWMREDGAKPADPKARRVGLRWGLLQSDGRVVVVAIQYAPYLGGAESYAVSDCENQKDWFNSVQHLSSKRDTEWNEWTFDFDADKGLSLWRNGKAVRKFDWARTKIKGFCGVALFGDTPGETPHTLWADDVAVSLGGPVKPEAMAAATAQTQKKGTRKGGKKAESAAPSTLSTASTSSIPSTPSSPKIPIVPEKDPPIEKPIRLVEAVRGRRPRLLFTAQDIAHLKERAAGPSKAFFDLLNEYYAACAPPKDETYTQNATEAQRRGMWQAPTVAIRYIVMGDTAALEKGKGYLERFMAAPHWETGAERDSGMGAANVMVGAAILYDCLYDGLAPDFREAVRKRLLLQARRMYYGGHLMGNPGTHFWQSDPQNNHRWHRLAGLTLCALAAAEESDPETDWILKQCAGELAFVHAWLPEDGSYHDSPSYMIFGTVYAVTAFSAADRCLGTDYMSHPFFRENLKFRFQLLTPGFAGVFKYGDSSGDSFGFFNNYLFACAAKNRDAGGQAGLFRFMERVPKAFGYGWASLLWRDPSLTGGTMEKYPKTQRFDDMGMVFARDGWDEGSVAAFFKCGPPGGYKLNEYRNKNDLKYINVAHDHPDANSFQIFTKGAILATDDGYPKSKTTRPHNTILVNGTGQKDEGRGWLQPLKGVDMTRLANIVAWKDAGDVVVAEGEAGGMYDGLTRFRRAFVWVRGGYVAVLDDIRAREESEFAWLLHSPSLEAVDKDGRRFAMKKDAAVCDVRLLSDLNVSTAIEKDVSDQHGQEWERGQVLAATARGTKWRLAAVFNPWDHKELSCEARDLGADVSTVLVRGPGFEDTWTWQAAAADDMPSSLRGQRKGGFDVVVGIADKTAHAEQGPAPDEGKTRKGGGKGKKQKTMQNVK